MSNEKTTLSESHRRSVSNIVDATAEQVVELDGGMVGSVYRVDFADRPSVVVKLGDTPLSVEGAMLEYLEESSPLPVPEVVYTDRELLVLEHVDGDGEYDTRAARDSAEHLAALHGVSAERYGFDFQTLSGPYWQPNPWTDSWIEFFRDHRLRHFATRAAEEGTLPQSYQRRIETLAGKLDDLLVEPETPALLHGDFWTGNIVVDDGAVAAVLDPAIYFGHHELELAYLDPSQPFDAELLDHYCTLRAVDAGFFETRRAVYDVFHALENVRFFGSDRLERLDSALSTVGL